MFYQITFSVLTTLFVKIEIHQKLHLFYKIKVVHRYLGYLFRHVLTQFSYNLIESESNSIKKCFTDYVSLFLFDS